MFDLTDNEFYSSAECIRLSTRLNKAGKYCDISFKIMVKKIIFTDEAHFDLGGYVNKQNCRIEKPTHPKLVTVWCVF